MIAKSALLIFFSFGLMAQTAKYPAAVATDNDLMVVANNAQTTLSTQMNATDTSFTVVTGSKFAANMLLTIENEIVKVCSVVGNTANVGYSSCPNIDGRGYDGTSAAPHASGKLVSAYIDSWHHNAMAAEVKAIEGAMGPYLSKISYNARAFGVKCDGTTDDSVALAAALAAAAGSTLLLPSGTCEFSTTLTPAANTTIRGSGRYVTTLEYTTANTTAISLLYPSIEISDLHLQLKNGVTGVSGSYGIYAEGSPAAGGKNASYITLSNLQVTSFWKGIYLNQPLQTNTLSTVEVTNTVSDGITALNAQSYWFGVNVINAGGNGVTLTGLSPWIQGLQTYCSGGWGVDSSAEISLTQFFLNNDRLGELHINDTATADAGYVADGNIQYAGVPVNGCISANASAPGILIESGSGPVSVDSVHIFNVNGEGIDVKNSSANQFSKLTVLGSGQGGGSNLGIHLEAGNQTITDSHFDTPVQVAGQNTITGNQFTSNTVADIPTVYFASGANQTFAGNVLYNPNGAHRALQVDAGVSFLPGKNAIASGAVSNAATESALGIDNVPRPYSKANTSVAVSITNGAPVTVPFDTNEGGVGGMHSTTVNPSRFTIPVGQSGWYAVTCQVGFAAAANGVRSVSIQQAGWKVLATARAPATATDYSYVNASTQAMIDENDYVECTAFQTSGAALNTLVGDDTFGTISRVR